MPAPRMLPTRRDFLKTSAVSTAAILAQAGFVHAAGSDQVKVGVIGCGGRGLGAAMNCSQADPAVVIWALGDVFEERMKGACAEGDAGLAQLGPRFQVPPERRFTGFDAYKGVLATDCDLVILATPPHFRPIHFAAAVEAGKNIFFEKPVAVDAPGVRRVIEASKAAAAKKLAVVTGTQRRHQTPYLELMKRVHDGAIGSITALEASWMQGGLWMHKREPQWSDMEWQLKNWLYFTWLSGDHIVEQHVHNIDVCNWAMDAHPIAAVGMGGRQVRTDAAYGHIFDHFSIAFEYANGVKMHSVCRQIDGCAGGVFERVVGSKGVAEAWAGGGIGIRGENTWDWEGDATDPYVQEHIDLIASIRSGKPLNEGVRIAESTLTAIMGRMSAYTGRAIKWDEALNSKEDLSPATYAMGSIPTPPVPMPGKTQFS